MTLDITIKQENQVLTVYLKGELTTMQYLK